MEAVKRKEEEEEDHSKYINVSSIIKREKTRKERMRVYQDYKRRVEGGEQR